MTQTTEPARSTSWMHPPTTTPAGHWVTPDPGMADLVSYARRIHWWVRLFGVVILIWVVLSVLAAVFMMAAVAASSGV